MNLLSIQNRNAAFEKIAPELPEKRKRVFQALKAHEPCTREELARFMRLSINEVTGRITELRDQNVLVKENTSVKRHGHSQTLLETFKDPFERMEAIAARKKNVTIEIWELKNDIDRVMNSCTHGLISARIKKLENDLNKLEKL